MTPIASGRAGLEAVIFDFDGLIIDSEWAIYEAACTAFEVHDHELTVEAWATVVGINDRHDDSWWPRLIEAAGAPGFERHDFDAVYEADDARAALRTRMEALPALPGVQALVDELTSAGVALGVASSSSLGWVEGNLERLGIIDRFATRVGADVVGGVGKPAPDVYLRACTDLDVEPSCSVAIEDSAHGVTAARAAGMVAVAVPSQITRSNDFAHADVVVDSVTELSLATLAALF